MTAASTGVAADAAGRTSLVARLHAVVDELRARGVPISLVERIDALQAVQGIALDAPTGLHIALAATLIKNADHRGTFDDVFDLYFRRAGRPLPDPKSGDRPDLDRSNVDDVIAGLPRADLEGVDLDRVLRSVLLDGSGPLSRLLAEEAVRRFARFDRGRAAAGVFYEKWTVEGLQLDKTSQELAEAAEAGVQASPPGGGTGDGSVGGTGGGTGSGSAVGSGDVVANAAAVRADIRQVIREMLIADRGVDAVAKTLRTPLPADLDITMASAAQLAEIERLLVPLQHKLATTVLRRRRRRAGTLDVRATLRASMATGGVPVRVVHRRPQPTKPQLYVLADMSGSVAGFAAFTITLVSALAELFSRLRTFAFIQNAVEITELVRSGQNASSTIDAINGLGGSDLLGSSTDYGRSLVQFWDEVAPQLGHRSTVLIFGDGRGNYRPSQEATLARIARRAGSVYWLNPETPGQWGTGDSLMSLYRAHCTEATTCRTLNDLRTFIERMA